MSVHVRARCLRSWLSVQDAPILGAILRTRLAERLKGERGLFLTLTYSHEEWESARELYYATGEKQHVTLFMRRLARACNLGSLKGRWFCKLEFQRGGWVHFHVILLGPTYLPHEAITKAWGFGHVWVNRLTASHLAYLCKYVAKDGAVPPWLFFERPRSVKVIRVSPGFWGDTKSADRVPDDRVRDPFSALPLWVPIGQRIEDAARQTVILERTRERTNGDLVAVPLMEARSRLLAAGFVLGAPDDPDLGSGWLSVRCAQTNAPASFDAVSETVRRGDRPARGRSPGPGDLHLIPDSNPDALPIWLRQSVSATLEEAA